MPHTPSSSANCGASMVVFEVIQVAIAVAVPKAKPTFLPATIKPSVFLALRPQ